VADANTVPAAPSVTNEAKPFWEAASEGTLLIQKCDACGEAYFHPRPFCPFCLSAETSWFTAAGTGTIYSYTVTARAPVFKIPAFIALDEGPVIMSAIVEADPETVGVGQRVTVTFVPTADGPPLPAFRPQ
jgi:uncharacterized OB-fold protein